MTAQVKLLRNLSLIVVAALVIILAPPLSVIGEEVITLTTIMPGQDTLRVKRGVVGVDWRPTATLTDAQIGDNNLLVQGKVGIGTTSPGQKLEVNGNLKLSTANPYIYSGSSYIVIPNGLYVSGGTTYIQGSLRPRGGIYNDGASYLTISGGTGGNTYFSGNVGIGTAEPDEKLEVNGAIKVGNTTGTNAGTIRWTGTAFEGYNGSKWIPLGAAGFGSWTNKDSANNTLVKNTVYKVTSDGFICARHTNGVIYGYTDSSSSPNTLRVANDAACLGTSVTLPVRKDDYFKLTTNVNITAIYWLPMGSGKCERQ